jgi:hypothetical protein
MSSVAGLIGTLTATGIVISACSRDREIRVEAQRTAHGEVLRECRRTRVRFPAAPPGKKLVRAKGLGQLFRFITISSTKPSARILMSPPRRPLGRCRRR